MEFQLSYFKQMMLWKCCTQYANKFGKLRSGHRTGKDQFSFQSQTKAMPKNAQTTAQLHSSHMLVASHSSTFAWKIPWTEERGGLQSMGSHRVGHDWSDLVVVVEHSLALPFFGTGMKTDLFQSCGIAELSRFAGILSAALSHHHLLGFAIAQLALLSHHLH